MDWDVAWGSCVESLVSFQVVDTGEELLGD